MRIFISFVSGVLCVATASVSASAATLDDCLKSDAYNAVDDTYQICTKVIDGGNLSPLDLAKALTQRANAMHFGNRPAFAIEDTGTALRLDPNSVPAYLRRAWALWSIGEYGSATRDVRAALVIDPKNANALHALAVITYGRQRGSQGDDREKAREALEQALKSDPDHPHALYALAKVLVEEFGMVNEGFAMLDRLFAVDRKRVEATTYYRAPGWKVHPNFYIAALEERGEIKSRLKQADGLDDFNEVIRLAPNYAQAYLGRNHYYLNVAYDPIKALADAQKAQELEPNREEPLMTLVQSLMSLKRYDSLLPVAERLINGPASNDGRAFGYHGRYVVYRTQGRYDEAFDDGQQWLARAPYYVPTIKKRLEGRGYYSGPRDYNITEEFLHGFKACVIDPEC